MKYANLRKLKRA